MALTDVKIRSLRQVAKPTKLFDGGGLHLLAQPKGGRWWRFDYRFAGKRRTISFGVYPDVSIAVARQRRAEARALLANGKDPYAVRQIEKRVLRDAATNTFEAVAKEWLNNERVRLAPRTVARIEWLFNKLILPWLGNRAIASVDAFQLLELLQRISHRGPIYTAHRAKQLCGQVFRYAIATRRATHDPSGDLRGALPKVASTRRAAILDPRAIGSLMRDIDALEGSLTVCLSLKLAPLLMVRPGELRTAEWADIDLGAAEWRIPACRMKSRELHIVPLSKQSIALLRQLQPLTGNGRFVFPSIRTSARPMSANTINVSLRRLGYDKSEMCAHGFRAMASTRLSEMGWGRDVVERQLAHAERDKVRRVYNRAEYLPERRRMMQEWADHLDSLRNRVTNVLAIGGRAV